MYRMCSPIPITEFISCVLMIVVILNSSVIPWIKASITRDVFGSSPEFGSSQNRYFGFKAIALAMATRFCIPPDISPGNLVVASRSFTRSKHSSARFFLLKYVSSENISNGNMTFSMTLIESKRAAFWKIMPISRRNNLRSFVFIPTKSLPS